MLSEHLLCAKPHAKPWRSAGKIDEASALPELCVMRETDTGATLNTKGWALWEEKCPVFGGTGPGEETLKGIT